MPLSTGYYRHPTINSETLVFVCEDDLWTVPASGGIARRLTANPGSVSFPALSPDGRRIAFTGRDEGPAEVYVMDAEGGAPARLTWLGAATQVVGWTPDGRSILFASDWRKPFLKDVSLHTVPADGGPVTPIPLGPARAISYRPDGPGAVLGRNSGDPARWKRYRGGTAGTLWIDRAGNGAFTPLLRLRGNLASPLWVADRIWFLSDHEGYGNLYSCTPNGRGIVRHTNHQDFYVRYPSSDGRRIVYHAGADLYRFDPASDRETKIEIKLHSPRPQRNRRFVPAPRYLESFDLHPRGLALASVHRGGLFALSLWEGAPLRLGLPSGTRYRLPRWLPDGRRIVALSDEGGEEAVVVFPAGSVVAGENGGSPPEAAASGKKARRNRKSGADEPEPRVIRGDFGRPVLLAPAPAGEDRVVLANQRQELILLDLATGRSKLIEQSRHSRIEGVAWSPDGRWIAYGFAETARTASLHLCDTFTGKVTRITRPDFRDVMPAFDPGGKYLYFISYRIFDPVYDGQYFDLGFPKGSRPFLIPLRQRVPSPFAPAGKPPRAPGAPFAPEGDPARKEKPSEPAAEPAAVEIDLEGIEDRVIPFPVPEGIYRRVAGAQNRVFFTSIPVEGSLEMNFMDTEPPAKAVLQVYNFEDEKLETITDRVTDFTLSRDAKVLGLRSGNRLRVLPATWKPDGKPPRDDPGRESGWIDLDRLRLEVDPPAEWRQMFREAWRLQRDQFWTPDMSGIDWQRVHDRYLPLVDRVASRAEFSDLLWEMQGELGTSHCYELGGDYRPEPAWHQGFLGADLELDPATGTWRVVRIPQGDSWDERRCSPLAAPGIDVRPGDEILQVGGRTADPGRSPDELLVHQSGRDVQLLLRSGNGGTGARKGPASRRARQAPAAGTTRVVTVRTLREETSLRYRDWVERNRERVHHDSGGRVGYVHLPNMGPLGFAEFHRYFGNEVQREGLIVDVRWNGGGHVSQLILEKLLRRRIGYDANRWGQPEPYPSDSPMGPMVALTNEYAGSDGDIFSHGFKLYGLGPLIGKRTWGGVIGIWPRHALVDGSVTTQPEFAFWFEDVGWGVENYGTDPDIEVDIRPQDHAAERDPQMDRALLEVLKLIRRHKGAVPDFKGRPRLRPEALPGLPASPGPEAQPARKSSRRTRRR